MIIEWNRVTWFSKTLAAVLFIDVFFFGFWLGTMNTEIQYIETERIVQTTDRPAITDAPVVQTNMQESVWNEYRNEEYKYGFEYPSTFSTRGWESSEGGARNPRSPAGVDDSKVYVYGEGGVNFGVTATNDGSWFKEWQSRSYGPPLYRDETTGEKSESFVQVTTFNNYPAVQTHYCDYSGCEEHFIIEADTILYTISVAESMTDDYKRIIKSFTIFE